MLWKLVQETPYACYAMVFMLSMAVTVWVTVHMLERSYVWRARSPRFRTRLTYVAAACTGMAITSLVLGLLFLLVAVATDAFDKPPNGR